MQPVRTHSETGMCLMGHMQHASCRMPHAPCVAMIFVANERVSAARFLARSGRAKWSWKVRTIDDRLMDARRDTQTEHTHTHTRTHILRLRLRLRWTDSCDDADLSPHWHSHLCNYPRCTHTLRHTHRLTGKNISQSNRCPTSSRASFYFFLLNLHHMRNMSKT